MKLTEKIIEMLESKGAKRWTKGDKDRLYINAEALGLDCDYYKTGNISCAFWNGEKISNSLARELKAAKTYIDITTGELHSEHFWCKRAAQDMYDAVIGEIEAEEATEKKEEKNTNNIEAKEKIVKAGNSRVFKNWNENSNVTEEEFLDGLRWLCADPLDDKGRYTRELGCIRRADAGMTDEEKALWNPAPHQPGVDRIYRLTRSYTLDGLCTFYDEAGMAWGGTSDCASINAGDRI